MKNNDEFFEPIKCITFDKDAQANIPQHIKDRMRKDRLTARANSDIRRAIEVLNKYDNPEAYETAKELRDDVVWVYVDDVLQDEFNDLFGDAERRYGV